jgi:hypothetical protein
MRVPSGTFGPLALRCEASFACVNIGTEPAKIRAAVKDIIKFIFIIAESSQLHLAIYSITN